jgi:Glutamate synthase central domain
MRFLGLRHVHTSHRAIALVRACNPLIERRRFQEPRPRCRAQVTNPAIDPFRESVVTSLRTFVGPEGDLSTVTPQHAARLELEQPILTMRDMAALKRMDYRGWHANVRVAPPAKPLSHVPACRRPTAFVHPLTSRCQPLQIVTHCR